MFNETDFIRTELTTKFCTYWQVFPMDSCTARCKIQPYSMVNYWL